MTIHTYSYMQLMDEFRNDAIDLANLTEFRMELSGHTLVELDVIEGALVRSIRIRETEDSDISIDPDELVHPFWYAVTTKVSRNMRTSRTLTVLIIDTLADKFLDHVAEIVGPEATYNRPDPNNSHPTGRITFQLDFRNTPVETQ